MISLKEINKIIQGEFLGDPEFKISGVNSLYAADGHEITFTTSDAIEMERIHAGALIVAIDSKLEYPNLLRVSKPYLAFASLMNHFHPHQRFNDGVDPLAFVSPEAVLGDGVSIGPFSYIGKHAAVGDGSEIHAGVTVYPGVRIGRRCIIYSLVVIREDVEIGDRVCIQPGAVIGADGFGFTREADGTPVKIPQKGRVVIGDDCEIGANTCIDRSTIEKTELKKSVKLDNLVQVGHNVTIGSGTALSAQTGISGSVEIGDNVVAGGQVGIGDHITVTDGVMMAGRTGVTGNIREKSVVAGFPHQEIGQWRKTQVLLRNLESFIDRLKALEKKIGQLEDK
jgi:UDP-3-O-[3-hydroxymyristoyl] glucosamine N-acyltransferase